MVIPEFLWKIEVPDFLHQKAGGAPTDQQTSSLILENSRYPSSCSLGSIDSGIFFLQKAKNRFRNSFKFSWNVNCSLQLRHVHRNDPVNPHILKVRPSNASSGMERPEPFNFSVTLTKYQHRLIKTFH